MKLICLLLYDRILIAGLLFFYYMNLMLFTAQKVFFISPFLFTSSSLNFCKLLLSELPRVVLHKIVVFFPFFVDVKSIYAYYYMFTCSTLSLMYRSFSICSVFSCRNLLQSIQEYNPQLLVCFFPLFAL